MAGASATSLASAASLMSVARTRASSAANCSDAARPMPWPAAVMMALLPLSLEPMVCLPKPSGAPPLCLWRTRACRNNYYKKDSGMKRAGTIKAWSQSGWSAGGRDANQMGVAEGVAPGIERNGSADARESMARGQIVSQTGAVRTGHAQRLGHQMHGIVRLHGRETWPSAGLRTIAFLEGQRVVARGARGRRGDPSALRKSIRGRRTAVGEVKRITCNGRSRLSAQINGL